MTQREIDAAANTPLEDAYSLVVAALNAQTPGTEAQYLARVVLLLLDELRYSESALSALIQARGARADGRE